MGQVTDLSKQFATREEFDALAKRVEELSQQLKVLADQLENGNQKRGD